MSRGLIDIKLGGASYDMKPTYEAAKEIEARGPTITELLELVVHQRLKYEEAEIMVYHGCIEAGHKDFTYEAIGKTLFEAKLTTPHIRQSMAKFLLGILYVPEEARKKFGAMEEILTMDLSVAG